MHEPPIICRLYLRGIQDQEKKKKYVSWNETIASGLEACRHVIQTCKKVVVIVLVSFFVVVSQSS